MLRLSAYLPFVAAMALVVVASNMLVQFPVQGMARRPCARRHPDLGRLHLSVRLPGHRPRQPALRPRRGARASCSSASCWRSSARSSCRRCSIECGLIDSRRAAGRLVRIAAASGAAFLAAQLLDVTVFNWLRRQVLVARAGVRLAGRLGARHRDLLLRSPSRRCSPSSARTTPSRWKPRRCSGVLPSRRRAGCPGRWATCR